jgi:hypothetical protein
MLQVSRIIEFAHKFLLICEFVKLNLQVLNLDHGSIYIISYQVITNYAGPVCTFQSGKSWKCSATIDIISRELAEA